ncbi:hypothetical protein QBC37DRAFT_370696 [Rhypophila decipiens]|uniref:Uncharacterized protein n=1 Tax=Rhypophila decipiens TaxID=261697 RepID=A0AAN6YE32_9PEZI|nr:hypothetical protein QBC37DRAFT_370696 [Rhypophila decipiens]
MPELQLRQTSPYKAFGLPCPSGGTFYICADSPTQFIGCCTVDACASSSSSSTLETRNGGGGECPSANLRLSSFSADTYNELPPQDCDDARGTSIWWTCKFNTPPFMGCCSTNPCVSGTCSDENLVPAKLSTDERKRNGFLSPSPSSSGTITKLSSPTGDSATSSSNMDHVSSRRVEATGSITGVASTTTALRPPTQSEVSAKSGSEAKSGGERLSNGAIGGIAAGVVVVLVLVVVVLLCRRRWAAKRNSGSSTLPPRDPRAGYDTVRNEGQFRDSHLSGTTAPVTSLYGDKPGLFQKIPSSSHSSVPVQEGSVWRYSGSSAQTSPMLDGSQSPPHQYHYHGFQHSQHSQRTSYLAPVSELSGEPMPQELANTAVTGVYQPAFGR